MFEFAGKIQNASLAEMTGEWVLNDKGFVHEVLADFQRFQRSLASTQDRHLAEELQITQGTIAKALGTGASADQPALTRLIEQADQLSLQLGVAARVSHLSRPWVTIADLRRSIPEDAVLIEVLRTNAGQEAQFPRYGPRVIPPAGKGEVQLISLGSADEIEASIAAFRQNMLRMQQSAEISAVNQELRGEIVAESAKVTSRLSQSILGSGTPAGGRLLLPHIQEYRHWIVAPDAALWLFPWETMPIGEGRELVVHRHVVAISSTKPAS